MRMPFTEFITSGDPKFMITFIIFSGMAIFYFIKKMTVKQRDEGSLTVKDYNAKINTSANWLLVLSVFSLLLGLMHSFYFIGKSGGGIPPAMLFTGLSYTLITPIMGIGLFVFCRILTAIPFNKSTNS